MWEGEGLGHEGYSLLAVVTGQQVLGQQTPVRPSIRTCAIYLKCSVGARWWCCVLKGRGGVATASSLT